MAYNVESRDWREKLSAIVERLGDKFGKESGTTLHQSSLRRRAARAATAFPDEAHLTDADRRKIQGALQHLGYYDGRVDGIFGADTRAAIRRFQHEINAEMTGTIMPAEAGRLLAQGH